MARPRSKKRTAAVADGSTNTAAAAATLRPGKRARATPRPEAEYSREKRNLVRSPRYLLSRMRASVPFARICSLIGLDDW
jgi:hypothetical protein